jgi:hypothetical protein
MDLDNLSFGPLFENQMPIFCFPDMIEKLPMSLTYCIIYLIGCALVMGIGFYFYYKRLLTANLSSTYNGHNDNKPDIESDPSNGKKIHRLLRGRSITQPEKVKTVSGSTGDK